MQRQLFLYIILVLNIGYASAQDITFKVRVPDAVVKGEQFRLQYILNGGEGRDIDIPDQIKGFNILFGPAYSSMSNTQFINGRATSSYEEVFTYTLTASQEGTFAIPAATIKVAGKTYKSNATQLKVLPQDKNAKNSGSRRTEATSSTSTVQNISSSDAFVRAIVSKTKVHEQEAFLVTFRFYTTLDAMGVDKVEFPEFEGFMVEDIELSPNRQMGLEHYNGRNYYSIDFKKSLLFPQRSGKITIPAGKVEVIFRVKTGKTVQSFMQSYDIMSNAKKVMPTNPLTIDILPLPQGKPVSYANAVGTFSINPSISATQVKANDAVTLTLDINGTGNMKLIKTPEINFPTDFETYDPKITNDFKITNNGLSGNKKIEYLFIPRHPGEYNIPSVDFSYYDTNTGTYKTLSTPEYKLKVAKDPNAGNNSSTSYNNQTEVKIEQDIRHLKTGEYKYHKANDFLVGSFTYYLWYIIPGILFITAFIVYRKQIEQNADIAGMKIKKANKVAIKRLKIAEGYLNSKNKKQFYEEILKAIWGYLSDKLSISIAELNRENIEQELSKFGASETLITTFISILDTCEFAHYAPAGSDQVEAMDKLYKDTVDAIGDMENTAKRDSKR